MKKWVIITEANNPENSIAYELTSNTIIVEVEAGKTYLVEARYATVSGSVYEDPSLVEVYVKAWTVYTIEIIFSGFIIKPDELLFTHDFVKKQEFLPNEEFVTAGNIYTWVPDGLRIDGIITDALGIYQYTLTSKIVNKLEKATEIRTNTKIFLHRSNDYFHSYVPMIYIKNNEGEDNWCASRVATIEKYMLLEGSFPDYLEDYMIRGKGNPLFGDSDPRYIEFQDQWITINMLINIEDQIMNIEVINESGDSTGILKYNNKDIINNFIDDLKNAQNGSFKIASYNWNIGYFYIINHFELRIKYN